MTTLVPANIALVKNGPNPEAAGAFIEYLLSKEGQELLLDPKIRRLPVNPATYANAPADFPNPFKDSSIGSAVKFDLALSKGRYNVINSLFDVMITYRLDDLRDTTKAIQDADLVIAVGMRFDDRVTGNLKTYAQNAKKIHIELDPAEINKNVHVDVPIVGDAREVLKELLPQVEECDRSEWLAYIEEIQGGSSVRDIKNLPDLGKLYAAHVIHDLYRFTEGKALVVTDGTTTTAIVTIDAVAIGEIGSIGNDFLGNVRSRVEKELGIKPANVLINASHCHGVVCADVGQRTFQAVKEAAQNMEIGRAHV